MRRFTSKLFAAALVVLALQASALAKDAWTSVRSQNFHLIGNASEKDIRQVATRLEQFRLVFSRIFKRARLSDAVPTTVIVFKGPDAYRPYNPRNDAGYFQPGEDVNYITLAVRNDGTVDSPFAIIFHEYVHLLVKNNVSPNTPAWLGEGLAEFFSTLEVAKGNQRADIGKVIDHHVLYLRQQKMLPLRTLFTVDHSSPHYNEGSKRGVFYAQSWALVHYLQLGKNRQRAPQLSRYLDLVAGGMSQQQSFQTAFGPEVDAIEKELRDYIQRNSYQYVSVDFEQKIDIDATMQSETISEADALAYLGDLALHTRLLDRAESDLQKSLALDPANPTAHASMGMLRVRQNRLAEAKEHLSRAVAADARNHLAHYYYAFALSREGMNEMNVVRGYDADVASQMRAALKRAIELKPEFAESYNLLAFVNLVTGEQLDESIALLRRSLQLNPGREPSYMMLAQLYLRKGDLDAARKVVEPLAQNSPDPQVKAGAQSLLNSINARGDRASQPDSGGGQAGGPPRLKKRGEGDEDEGDDQSEQLSGDETLGMSEEEAMAVALREALRKPREGETRVLGTLTRIDCGSKGATFHVQAAGQTLKLQGGDMSGVQFMAFTREAGGQIACGPRKPESRVVVTYRAKGKDGGELVAVEFVPAKFELKQ